MEIRDLLSIFITMAVLLYVSRGHRNRQRQEAPSTKKGVKEEPVFEEDDSEQAD